MPDSRTLIVHSRREVEAGLENKGFKKSNASHRYFIYYTKFGKKTAVRTMTSHGSGSKDISSELMSRMARQCKISKTDFADLVTCPLSRNEYEQKLYQRAALG